MKHLIIINSKSSTSLRKQIEKEITDTFKNLDYSIEYTAYCGHATKITKEYVENYSELIIYACGGDGTIHEIVNGIYPATHVELAIIPIGTGNDFIKSLGIPKECFLHLKNYLHPDFCWSDLILTNDEVSINTVSLGFDVKIAENVSKFKRLPIPKGTIPYYLSLLYCMLFSLTEQFKFQIDEQIIDMASYTFAVMANGQCYGGGYRPCPHAKLDDGLLDICLIKKIPRYLILKLANKYKKGEHLSYHQIVQCYQAKRVQLLNEQPVMICLDGEIRLMYQPSIEILPHQIKICIPKSE